MSRVYAIVSFRLFSSLSSFVSQRGEEKNRTTREETIRVSRKRHFASRDGPPKVPEAPPRDVVRAGHRVPARAPDPEGHLVGPREGPPRRAPAPGERALSRIRPPRGLV